MCVRVRQDKPGHSCLLITESSNDDQYFREVYNYGIMKRLDYSISSRYTFHALIVVITLGLYRLANTVAVIFTRPAALGMATQGFVMACDYYRLSKATERP